MVLHVCFNDDGILQFHYSPPSAMSRAVPITGLCPNLGKHHRLSYTQAFSCLQLQKADLRLTVVTEWCVQRPSITFILWVSLSIQVWGNYDLVSIYGTSEFHFVWFCLSIIILLSFTHKYLWTMIPYFFCVRLASYVAGSSFSKLVGQLSWMWFLDVLWWDLTSNCSCIGNGKSEEKEIFIPEHSF